MNSSSRRLISALQSCCLSKDLQRGKTIHAQVAQGEFSIYVANSLLNMYASCGSLKDAQEVFNMMPCHNIISWNSLMLGYVETHQEDVALELFSRIPPPLFPTALTYVAALKACTGLAGNEDQTKLTKLTVKKQSLETGMYLHAAAETAGMVSDVFVSTTLISMYSRCGSLVDARTVFDRMCSRNVVAWNALLLGYADNGEERLALELFTCMKTTQSCRPNTSTFVAVLKACGKIEKAVELHDEAARSGFDSDVFVACSLISLYARCGSMELARKVFDKMAHQSVVAWNGLLTGYVENREEEQALEAFSLMQSKGCAPNALTYVEALKACGNLAEKTIDRVKSLQKGMEIHSQAVSSGYESDPFVTSMLVNMYSKCRSMVDARKIFDKVKSRNTVSWNALLLGYVDNDQPDMALELFTRLQTQEEDCLPDERSFVAAIKACSLLAAKEVGKLAEGKLLKVTSLQKGSILHSLASTRDLDRELFVSSSLVDMYAKCGSMSEAERVFKGMPRRDVVTWTSLISGYAENSQGEVALQMFRCMQEEGIVPDVRTHVAVLQACTGAVNLDVGKETHAEIARAGNELEYIVLHSLVELYAKCGSMVDARVVFESLNCSIIDVKTWTALLAGYSRQGHSEQVFDLFTEMESQGLRPDGVTLLCVLTACSHSGMVDKGRQVFEDMRSGRYGGEVGMEHYHCMADILGRGNRLQEAVQLVNEMPFRPNRMTWSTILGACHKWKNVEVGKVAYRRLLELGDVEDGSSSAVYSLMRNIYGNS